MYKDIISERMKIYYEQIPKTKLMRRCPVIIRIDGKSFHTFTKGFEKPFDEVLIRSMQETAKYLCENIQGCVMSYQQSDEISLLLIDYNKLTTKAFFDYEVQKVCSIAASMATIAFARFFYENFNEWGETNLPDWDLGGTNDYVPDELMKLCKAYDTAHCKGAMFDARVFNIPKEEVTNYFYWRQCDATRNSIQMVGQTYFSHKELHGKSCDEIQNMIFTIKGINWNDYPIHLKRGSCCVKQTIPDSDRTTWAVDKEIPIFKGDGREYIDKLVYVGEK